MAVLTLSDHATHTRCLLSPTAACCARLTQRSLLPWHLCQS
jgi:hypothetical protein